MNNITLVGRLTRDPEIKILPGSGLSRTTFSIAVDRNYKKDGNKITDFIPIEVLGKVAEFCANYLNKGRLVSIRGSVYIDRYADQEGNNKTFTKVHADSVQALDSGKDKPNEPQYEPQGLDPQGFQAIDDDDIPF